MAADLYNQLLQETDEEKSILQLDNMVKMDLYTNQGDFIIQSEKLMDPEEMIKVRKHTRFVDFPKHKHDYIEMNYVYRGKLEQKVGDVPILLRKGELLLLNQFIEHEIKACEREDIIINFIIRPQFFEYIFTYLSAENAENNINDFLINSLFEQTQNGQFLYYAVSEVESIQQLIQKIMIEIMRPNTFSQSSIKLYMGLLMIELVKHTDKMRQLDDSSIQQQLIIKSLKYIEENYQTASLYELANKLNQTHYWLSKNIKKVTNRTFKALLQEKRLSVARDLLKNNEIAISTIVEQVGYDNISYFYRIFKSKYGMTPKQFRMKYGST
ncbi:AraC family transcriptional regulator [Oceanobacillus manasiensis]|uniref:AraC family transcriptional regulator n=1 Tax=Oceanobacillus manasiensis TaxID=586413 RepID=UPI0005A7BB26|nr:AraC family transcriptional regulator [Oceanobacillus manasiensis]